MEHFEVFGVHGTFLSLGLVSKYTFSYLGIYWVHCDSEHHINTNKHEAAITLVPLRCCIGSSILLLQRPLRCPPEFPLRVLPGTPLAAECRHQASWGKCSLVPERQYGGCRRS